MFENIILNDKTPEAELLALYYDALESKLRRLEIESAKQTLESLKSI